MSSSPVAPAAPHSPSPPPTRWELLRDLLVFQAKLALDGLRDLALSPISLVAGLVDLVVGGPRYGHRFYWVVATGQRTERWINLFGAAERAERAREATVPRGPASLDVLVERLEATLVEQHGRGGVTASAKRAIDRVLDSIERHPS